MQSTYNSYTYSIEQYLTKETFSSFLPGIAGKHGIPLWSFYVNRAQAIASFGIEHKDKSIMEFSPANKSFERVSSHGFRTFIKIDNQLHEPFTLHEHTTQTMHIERNVLTIEETAEHLQLKIIISYFILPNERFGALLRTVDIRNLGAERSIELIDGIPEVLPSGISTDTIKTMSFTARAWADVFHVEEGTPLYRIRHSLSDTETIEDIHEAMFFINVSEGRINKNIIIDRDLVFEYCNDLSQAVGFANNSIEDLLARPQYAENKYSSGFACFSRILGAGSSENSTLSFQSYYGYIAHEAQLSTITRTLEKPNSEGAYHIAKKVEARKITEKICKDIETESAYPLFDEYCKQSYLDNILRGGYPIIFPQKNGQLVYHIFSRKHGDLERDYNFFSLEAKHYSQGNGNFRDVCQNRRNDILFNPKIGDANILNFSTLLQADGYNPLVVKGLKLSIKPEYFSEIAEQTAIAISDDLQTLLQDFTPGSLLEYATAHNLLNATESTEKFVETILWHADYEVNAVYGEGFWIDHFCYILDLIESYIDIYPEHRDRLLFTSELAYFDSPAFVRPRRAKYMRSDKAISKANSTRKLMQLSAVVELEEKEVQATLRGHSFLVDEQGTIYKGTLFEKLLCLVANKVSSLDAHGMGIEMEANKPGWNDALNGMPGIMGSGVSETFEVLRIVRFLLDSLQAAQGVPSNTSIVINECIFAFANDISTILQQNLADLERWNKASTLRESYRETVCYAIPSAKSSYTSETLIALLRTYTMQLEKGIAKVFAQNAATERAGIPISFIENIASSYRNNNDGNRGSSIEVDAYTARPLPLFLEAPAKSMKHNSREANLQMYKAIKSSDLYDAVLKMYKTSESLASESAEIGRAKSFTPGWLERESIFMHMEFKYLLSLLEQGLYEEFYQDFFTALPCFMKPHTYGRSVLEASSFVVSSVNNNPNLHGKGFSARLSGSTSEVLSMWKLMFLGRSLFSMQQGELVFSLVPRLPASFFSKEGIVRFTLFSCIAVEIANPHKQDTFSLQPSSIECDGQLFEGHNIKGKLAHSIRDTRVQTIRLCYN